MHRKLSSPFGTAYVISPDSKVYTANKYHEHYLVDQLKSKDPIFLSTVEDYNKKSNEKFSLGDYLNNKKTQDILEIFVSENWILVRKYALSSDNIISFTIKTLDTPTLDRVTDFLYPKIKPTDYTTKISITDSTNTTREGNALDFMDKGKKTLYKIEGYKTSSVDNVLELFKKRNKSKKYFVDETETKIDAVMGEGFITQYRNPSTPMPGQVYINDKTPENGLP